MRKAGIIIVILYMFCILIMGVSAEGTSLSDVVNSTESSESNSSRNVFGEIAEASKLDLDNPKAKEAVKGLSEIVGMIVTVLGYVIAIGLGVRIMLDITYIVLPFTRGILCKGSTGGNEMNVGMNNMSNNNMDRYGSMNNGYSRGNQAMAGQQQGAVGRIQLISEAAMRAVAMSNQVSPFKIYMKDMVAVLIITPILLVLATNGVLFTLGLKIAETISSIFNNINL